MAKLFEQFLKNQIDNWLQYEKGFCLLTALSTLYLFHL